MGHTESWRGIRIYTVGHSTRTLEELIGLLRALDISVLADIRRIPRSRRNPQFNGDSLRTALDARSLRYVHLPRLGGLRHPSQPVQIARKLRTGGEGGIRTLDTVSRMQV